MIKKLISLIVFCLFIGVTDIRAEDKPLFSAVVPSGNQGHRGPLGRVFYVIKPIKIFAVGAFESNEKAPFSIKIAIYDNKTKNLVAGTDIFTVDRSNSKLEDKYRFLDTDEITLGKGSYMLVAQGYDQNQKNGNSGPTNPGPIINGGGSVAVGLSYWGDGDMSYPTKWDGNQYHAGNIKFKEMDQDTNGSWGLNPHFRKTR
jgi:hypothetical protein